MQKLKPRPAAPVSFFRWLVPICCALVLPAADALAQTSWQLSLGGRFPGKISVDILRMDPDGALSEPLACDCIIEPALFFQRKRIVLNDDVSDPSVADSLFALGHIRADDEVTHYIPLQKLHVGRGGREKISLISSRDYSIRENWPLSAMPNDAIVTAEADSRRRLRALHLMVDHSMFSSDEDRALILDLLHKFASVIRTHEPRTVEDVVNVLIELRETELMESEIFAEGLIRFWSRVLQEPALVRFEIEVKGRRGFLHNFAKEQIGRIIDQWGKDVFDDVLLMSRDLFRASQTLQTADDTSRTTRPGNPLLRSCISMTGRMLNEITSRSRRAGQTDLELARLRQLIDAASECVLYYVHDLAGGPLTQHGSFCTQIQNGTNREFELVRQKFEEPLIDIRANFDMAWEDHFEKMGEDRLGTGGYGGDYFVWAYTDDIARQKTRCDLTKENTR